VLPAITGVAVHDAWAPYDTYTHADHALCGAHVLRELTAVIDSTPTGYCWARQVHDALLGLKKLVDDTVEIGRTFVDPKPWPTTSICSGRPRISAPPATVSPHRSLAKKHHALARRLLDREAD
jgi:hypothetical protein